MLMAVEAPFDPPRRRSSLAFSQLLIDTQPKSAGEEEVRTPNVGRKRTHATPFLRPAATPGHASRIQRIFQDATAMVQVDVAYASSPAGSIDSRISPLSASTPRRVLPPTSPDITTWRYSSAPQRFAGPESDVREPFPAAEPPSSGYLPPLPDSSSPTSVGIPHCDRASQASDSQVDDDIRRASSTDLDRPLSELHINHLTTAPCSYYDLNMLDESPDPISAPNPDLDIFCSPAAKAAADSARLKRGMNSPVHYPGKGTTDLGSTCPDPSAHLNTQSNAPVPDPRCPDPAVHRVALHSDILAVPRQPHYRRVDSRGSPLPPPKPKTSSSHHTHHVPPPPNGYGMLSAPPRPLLQSYFSSPPPAEHFHPGWSNFPAQDAGPGAYSFSTEAARITGSSAAPDSRIRDSYRTDTLTPLAKPQARYRKTGLAAMTRGAGRFYGVQGEFRSMPVQFGSSPPRPVQGLPKKRTRDGGPGSPDDVAMEANEEYVRELSPDVTPYRKGSEPKKARRVSYWDRDILGLENKKNARFENVVDATNSKRETKEMEMLLDKVDPEAA